MAAKDTCPVCATAEIVCGKWTLLVIRDLAEGRSRFCELERSLQGISPRTLSLRLRALEEAGIVRRQTYPEVPPRVEQAIVACWTGTGASIAANKVQGVRAALCGDAATAEGARRWNDANVLALSLRLTSPAELDEILEAWFSGASSDQPDDVENIAHVQEIERPR